MRTNTGLTIYNIFYDTATKANLYYRAVVKDVAWENRKASNVLASGGNISVDKAVVYIPILRADHLDPKAWQALVDKTTKWTLQEGDIIVKGSVVDELSSAFLPSALEAKYDDVLMISSIDTMDMGSLNLQHWKVSAK